MSKTTCSKWPFRLKMFDEVEEEEEILTCG
jgi:hypothetical protein